MHYGEVGNHRPHCGQLRTDPNPHVLHSGRTQVCSTPGRGGALATGTGLPSLGEWLLGDGVLPSRIHHCRRRVSGEQQPNLPDHRLLVACVLRLVGVAREPLSNTATASVISSMPTIK